MIESEVNARARECDQKGVDKYVDVVILLQQNESKNRPKTKTKMENGNITFSSASFRDQATRSVDSRGVELHKLRVLKRDAGTKGHCVSVASACVRRGAREVGSAVATRRKHCVVGFNAVNCSILHVEARDADTAPILHDQVQRKVLNEVCGVKSQGAPIKGVKHCVSCSVSCTSASVRLTPLAEIQRLSSECPLVNFSVFSS